MTMLKYLENSETHTTTSDVVSVHSDGMTTMVRLDVTPFYVKGGGQPSDRGFILGPKGKMAVSKVERSPTGDVEHIGEVISGSIRQGDKVEAAIDVPYRKENSRLHTAGEVICAAIHDLGKKWPITAASHYPGQSRVAFASDLAESELSSFVDQFKERFRFIVSSDFPVKIINDVPLGEAKELCPMDANELDHKVGNLRLISPFEGFHRPCLGAHLKSTAEIGNVNFRKFRLRRGELSISYDTI